MELRQLEVLRELEALGSVTAVAEMLRVTPSAVSQQIAALQREFRTPLTRKQGRALALTEAGRALARAGVDVVDAMAAARHAVEDFEQSTTGVVSLSGFHSVGQALYGRVLAELEALPESPELHLSDEDVSQEEFPALTAHHDLVLAHRLEHSPPWPTDGLTVLPLAQEPIDVALASGHPLAARTALSPADVAGERWVTSRGGFSPDDLLGSVAALADRPLTVAHRINDYGSVASVVAAGGAIGLVPRYTVGRAAEGLALRPLSGISSARRIDVLTRPENLHRRSAQLVVMALRSAMAKLIAEGS